MDLTFEYRERGKEMVEYIANYLENIRDRKVYPSVTPGYIRDLVSPHAPQEPESWETIFADIERVIMPGVTHWQSPHMHAYFPALNSVPSLIGDMLADAINCVGFTWASSPACTELETTVTNWLGKMIGLPDDFLHVSSDSKGGGVIQSTVSEATFISLLAGRTRAISRHKLTEPWLDDAVINSRLVAYCSDQAHSSVEKACLMGFVKLQFIESDDNLSLRGDKLQEAITRDRQKGLIPFFLCATLGTTGACSFDNLEELGPICVAEGLWLHVDAAYAGSAFICPEYRVGFNGIHCADSMVINPSKWLLVHVYCTVMWVKDSSAIHRVFNIEPVYLKHENSGLAIDYMHWEIGLSRRFRAVKLWFVLRKFGVKGLQHHIREGVRLAQMFEKLVREDPAFEIPATPHLGLVVFRLKGDNALTEHLLKRLNSRGNIYCAPASLKGKYVIRFAVTASGTREDDISQDWAEIQQNAAEILKESPSKVATASLKRSLKNIPILKETNGEIHAVISSKCAADLPLPHKMVVNGSFAAASGLDVITASPHTHIINQQTEQI